MDQDRGVVAFHITADQAGDSPEFTAVLEVIKVANPVGAAAASGPGVGRQGVLAVHHTATIHISVINDWLKRLT